MKRLLIADLVWRFPFGVTGVSSVGQTWGTHSPASIGGSWLWQQIFVRFLEWRCQSRDGGANGAAIVQFGEYRWLEDVLFGVMCWICSWWCCAFLQRDDTCSDRTMRDQKKLWCPGTSQRSLGWLNDHRSRYGWAGHFLELVRGRIWVFDWLAVSPWEIIHLRIELTSCWNCSMSSVVSTGLYRRTPSANRIRLTLWDKDSLDIKFMMMLNNRGSRIDPCGTPEVTLMRLDTAIQDNSLTAAGQVVAQPVEEWYCHATMVPPPTAGGGPVP